MESSRIVDFPFKSIPLEPGIGSGSGVFTGTVAVSPTASLTCGTCEVICVSICLRGPTICSVPGGPVMSPSVPSDV